MKAKNMKKAKLTIIILNHNTKALLADCLDSIKKNNDDISLQVIVSDNSSTDGSVEMIKKNYKWVELLQGPNISFSNGNNRARKYTKGEYILFLNSDTIVHKDTLTKCVEYLDKHNDVGALTCKLVLPDGSLDKDARRRFPTPSIYLNAFIFNNKDRYWYQDIPANITHEVEVIQGAFFLTTKKILDQVGWLDEKYIFDGEDLDLNRTVSSAKKLIKKKINMLGYGEIHADEYWSGGSNLMQAFFDGLKLTKVDNEDIEVFSDFGNFVGIFLEDKGDVYPALKEFLKKDMDKK